MAAPRIEVLRVRRRDDDLETDVLSVWGYRAVCPGCWNGPGRYRRQVAQADLYAHRVERHGHRPQAAR